MAASPIGSRLFKACALLTPFFRLYDEALYQKAWQIRMIGKIAPHYMVPLEFKPYPAEMIRKWGTCLNDPQHVLFVTPTMVLTWLTEQENCEQNIHTIKMPMLFAEAEKEVTVSNKAIR